MRNLIICFLVINTSLVFAKGNVEEDFIDLEPNENWQHVYDLSGLEDGNYNVIVKATDSANNVTYDGSYNIKIDSSSDIPHVDVLFPSVNSALRGDINIVGTARDDKALDKVMISVDGGEFVPVVGLEYWTYYLNTSMLSDGLHLIQVKAIDKVGNESPIVEIPFYMNVKLPKVSEITFYTQDIGSKNFSLSGNVAATNGVDRLYVSLEKDANYKAVSLKKPNDLGTRDFSFKFSRKNFESEVFVVYLRVYDVFGSVGLYKFDFSTGKLEDLINLDEDALRLPAATLDNFKPTDFLSGIRELKGTAFSHNGIEKVLLSMDNGHSFVSVTGAEEWKYFLDTRNFVDGTYALQIVPIDKNGNRGLFVTLINIDNSDPFLAINSPTQTLISDFSLVVSGICYDNMSLKGLKLQISGVGQGSKSIVDRDLVVNKIFSGMVDLASVADGDYLIKLTAFDSAGNFSIVTKNITIKKSDENFKAEIIFPIEGEKVAGDFAIDGFVQGYPKFGFVSIFYDGNELASVPVNKNGYFSYFVEKGGILEGAASLSVSYRKEKESKLIGGLSRSFIYSETGAAVFVTNYSNGDRINSNITIEGGFKYFSEEQADLKPLGVQISLDNGRTFRNVSGKSPWSYRLNIHDLPDGIVDILLKARFYGNGGEDNVVSKLRLFLDTKGPSVNFVGLEEKSAHSGELLLIGQSGDDNEVVGLSVALRKGGKYSYEIHPFLKGFYLDISGLGATYFTIGLGLGLFDDAVRIQGAVGLAPETVGGVNSRFYGVTLVGKLLARLYIVEFGDYFGEDLDFLGLSFYVGSGMTYFSMSSDATFSDSSILLGSALGQIELIFDFDDKFPAFNTYSLYGELSINFIPSDIQSESIVTGSIGLKIGLM
ncbi:MAG: hypothetical protein JXR63_02910 [Spirochaetales bacterium]|nr:hypothetical protein [Spirochaetales bacterium]